MIDTEEHQKKFPNGIRICSRLHPSDTATSVRIGVTGFSPVLMRRMHRLPSLTLVSILSKLQRTEHPLQSLNTPQARSDRLGKPGGFSLESVKR